MLFYEPLFLFYVFPVFYLVVVLLRRNPIPRRNLIVLFSIFFYAWIEPRIVPLVILTTLSDYCCGWVIANAETQSSRTRALVVGVAINLGTLLFFKYTNFLFENLSDLLVSMGYRPLPAPSILLPIGISFIVFEKISFLVDLYRRLVQFPRSIIDYTLYVFLFPKLLAGPIIKYHEINEQIARLHWVTPAEGIAGFERFMLGVVKKTLIADPLGVGVTEIFKLPDSAIGFSSAWIGVGLFTLQIYFDFSAYSDMAIGLARMLGFRLNENFNLPYLSRSMTEFWRRWHISLSTFIREYLYVPLGGNRVSLARIYVNLWICFLLSGIWHGATGRSCFGVPTTARS
jgi:alginate O-acetyltransferase complex protein AlgI